METSEETRFSGAEPCGTNGLMSHMNENSLLEKIQFKLSASAEKNLLKDLPNFATEAAKRGRVPVLFYCGGSRVEKNGKILWEYTGPQFLLTAQKAETLCDGRFYDLLGFAVWVEEIEERLLQGRVLTAIQSGNPEQAEILVLEDAPENYLELAFPECGCGTSRGDSKVE